MIMSKSLLGKKNKIFDKSDKKTFTSTKCNMNRMNKSGFYSDKSEIDNK